MARTRIRAATHSSDGTVPGNRHQLFARQSRRRAQQPFRIRMPWRSQHFRHRTFLHDSSGVHHRDATRNLRHHSQIVRNEKHRKPQLPPQFREQLQNLFLHRDVQRGSRLVRDQDARASRQRHRDHHPLPQSARKLMRILPRAPRRISQRRAFQCFERPPVNFTFASPRLVHANRFFHLRADAQHRIQRRHRLLKNHGDLAPAQRPHFILRNPQ